MQQSDWVPPTVPIDQPNVARMWDYWLGGFHNFAIDRQVAEQAIKLYPDLPLVAQANRAFLHRAVWFMLHEGVDQFLDIGSGIPTVGNVHETAHRVNPEACVVYVDIDPVAVAHSRTMLRGVTNAYAVEGDARRPEEIVGDPEVRRALDWTRPIGLLALALFHFLPDDAEALASLRILREALPSGSYVALTHATADELGEVVAGQAEELYRRATAPFHFRRRDQIAQFFEGLDLVEPGLAYAPLWRPESATELLVDRPSRSIAYAGVGRKR